MDRFQPRADIPASSSAVPVLAFMKRCLEVAAPAEPWALTQPSYRITDRAGDAESPVIDPADTACPRGKQAPMSLHSSQQE